MKKIGFIGLGIMGESMCQRVIEVGKFPTMAYDVDSNKVEQLVKLGAVKASSISDIAAYATHIVIMVPNNEIIESVIAELAPVLKPETVVIDMSTVSPVVSRELAGKVAACGCTMFDAPVVKSKPAAISGDLGIYIGGNKAKVADIMPILECMGSNIIYLGENGVGLTMKLCHNSLVAQIQNGVNEMMLLAKKSGIPAEDFVKSISYGGGQNFYLDGKWKAINEKNFAPAFSLANMNKDVNLTKDLANSLDLELHGLNNTVELFSQGMSMDLGQKDFSASYLVVEDIAGK